MKIQMRTLACGPDYILHPGKTYNVNEKLATSFIEGGYAQPSEERAQKVPATPDPDEHLALERGEVGDE